ncbi:MAG: class I SAM-dependent methyltransferase [Hyphomicrobiales bacterium]|nr:class I SAM-dependent methyltransferase [Hyphomicrobiales bacterium]
MNETNLVQHPINKAIHPDDKMYGVMKKNNNEKGYFISGERNISVFWDLVSKYNPVLSEGKKVMDYGCGHGRMARHMHNFFQPSRLVVADVLADGVAFCAREFDATPFVISNDNPISNLNETVDVIIAVSVFSHLPMASFETNLRGLSKVLSKDGLLMFTTNGEKWREKHNVTLNDGFYFKATRRRPNGGFSPTDLPVEEYGSASVSTDFVESLFKRVDLQLVDHIPHGHVGMQDIYVARH